METLVNILFQISEKPPLSNDHVNIEHIESERVNIVLKWLSECFAPPSNSLAKHYPSNMIFHCVACILYKSEHAPNINEQFVESLLDYSLHVDEHYTKQSLDWIFCALFYKKPHLIAILTSMINLNMLATLHQKTSKLSLAESKCVEKRALSLIETLSFAIQSDNVLDVFMGSDFFHKLVDTLMVRIELLGENLALELGLIKVFASLAEFESGKDWLGSDIGCSLWQKLLHLLCNSPKPGMATFKKIIF